MKRDLTGEIEPSNDLQKAKEALEALDQIPVKEQLRPDPSSPNPTLLLCAHVWNQGMLLRVRELSHAVTRLCEADNLVSAAILTRCLLETVALYYHMQTVLTDATQTKHVEKAVEELWRAGLGRDRRNLKMLSEDAPSMKRGYEAVELKKFAKDLTQLAPGSKYAYSELSEYVHPNSTGTSAAYITPCPEKLTFVFAKDFGHISLNVGYVLEFSMEMFMRCWPQMEKLIPQFMAALPKP
jgi:hypothetical protein